MKIALAQINTTVGDFAGNAGKIVDFARRAQGQGADFVVFPELALCGYPPRDLVEKSEFIERSEAGLQGLAAALPGIPTLVGYVRRSPSGAGKKVANAAALLHGGKVLADYAKGLLPFYDVFDESRYFEPGIGPVVCPVGETAVGITICEDAWNDKSYWQQLLYPRNPAGEYRFLALLRGQNPHARRDDAGVGARAPRPRGVCQSCGRKRPVDFRRFQHGV